MVPPANETFGEIIKNHREACGLSLEEADTAVRAFKGGMRAYEKCGMVPTQHLCVRIEKALGIAGEERARFRELVVNARAERKNRPPRAIPRKWDFKTVPFLVCTASGKQPTVEQLERALHDAKRKAAVRPPNAPMATCHDPSLDYDAREDESKKEREQCSG
jgi:hypothetical protein